MAKYPNFHVTDIKLKKKQNPTKCQAKDCAFDATKLIEVQVSYMRGDDEYYRTCNEHAKLTKTHPPKFWELMPESN